MTPGRDRALTAAASAATVLLLGLLWEGAILLYDIPAFVLPPLREVGGAIHQGWVEGTLWEHAAATVAAAAMGLAIGALAGIVLGALVAEIRPVSLAVYPLVIAIQSMPTVALAPLIVVYLGVGLPSKVATVALLCFFPLFVNTVAGVRGAPVALVDLYRAFGSGRWRIFRDVRLPAATDGILAALQIAVVLALVGTVVSEFVAAQRGLGFVIRAFASDLNVPVMFAAIAGLAALGAVGGALATALHRALVPWRRAR